MSLKNERVISSRIWGTYTRSAWNVCDHYESEKVLSILWALVFFLITGKKDL